MDVIKRWEARWTEKIEDTSDSVDFHLGHTEVKYLAIIELDDCGVYTPHMYEVFPTGEISKDKMMGVWSKSLGSAKRRLNQDSDLKSGKLKWIEFIIK